MLTKKDDLKRFKEAPFESESQFGVIEKVSSAQVEAKRLAEEMEQSLSRTIDNLLALIEEQEEQNKKLNAINEELKSTNKELRANAALNLQNEELFMVDVNAATKPRPESPSLKDGNTLVVGISDLDKRIDEAIFDAINEFDKRCPYCSKDLYMGGIREKIEIDHFIPVSKGGQHFPWNLVPICKDCNRKKRAKLPIDFLTEDVFNRVNTYLERVRQKFLEEGVVAHSSMNSLRTLLIQNENVVRLLSSHDLIKNLVHLVTPERASLLEQPIKSTVGSDGLLNMIKHRRDVFSVGIIGSPFHSLCGQLTGRVGFRVFQSQLIHALKKAGWIDCGRVASAEHPSKKHVFAAPDQATLSKSELRRAVEVPYDFDSSNENIK